MPRFGRHRRGMDEPARACPASDRHSGRFGVLRLTTRPVLALARKGRYKNATMYKTALAILEDRYEALLVLLGSLLAPFVGHVLRISREAKRASSPRCSATEEVAESTGASMDWMPIIPSEPPVTTTRSLPAHLAAINGETGPVEFFGIENAA